jgi:hypothetical protein
MPRLTIVTARPIGARWHVEIPGCAPVETRTLKTAETTAGRHADGPIDLQVSLGGLEDLCADAVELGEQSDALAVEALRLRRVAAQTLSAAGIRTADAGYLMGIAQDSVKHLLDVPIDTPWMSTTHAPPTPIPPPARPSAPGTTRDIVPVMVTRSGSGWHVHVNPGRRPVGRTSLVRAEMLVRDLVADDGADILLCPQLPDELEQAVRVADIATADADGYQHRAHELRLDVARRLRDLEIGYQDIGYLLGMHTHRVRLLLA